jgi:putative PIN family toxin of toxin-antitoxin system
MKAVLDTNVLVSAALTAQSERWGRARWLVEVALLAHRRFEHVTSEPMMHELRAVLLRPGMLDERSADRFVESIAAASSFVRVHDVPMGCRDGDDDKVIETAMNADADMIVSDDADLHDPAAWRAIAKTGIGIRRRPIRVMTLDAFVAELSGIAPRFSPLVLATLAA